MLNRCETASWSTQSTWQWPIKARLQHGRLIVGNLCVSLTGYVIQHSFNLIGLLDCWNTRLHRSRNLFTKGLWKRMRLVVFGGNYVRMLNRLSTVLLGVHAWHLPEDHAVAGLSCLPRWCLCEHRGWGSHATVRCSMQTVFWGGDNLSYTRLADWLLQQSKGWMWIISRIIFFSTELIGTLSGRLTRLLCLTCDQSQILLTSPQRSWTKYLKVRQSWILMQVPKILPSSGLYNFQNDSDVESCWHFFFDCSYTFKRFNNWRTPRRYIVLTQCW